MPKRRRKRSAPRARASPEAVWAGLSDLQRWEVLLRLVARPARLLRYANVQSVGAGYRTISDRAAPLTQTDPRLVTPDLCLRFLVKRKTKRPPKNAVPRHIMTTVELDGRRVRCAVPTDVDELGPACPQNGDGTYPDGVVARLIPGMPGPVPPPDPAPGAICCRVVDAADPGEDYLLGCHHVFTLSAKTPGCLPLLGVGVSRGGPSWDFIGPTVRWTELLPPNGRPGIDAAIAKLINDANTPPWIRAEAPTGVGMGMIPPPGATIRTPRLPLAATFLGYHPVMRLQYPGGVVAVAGPVYEYQAPCIPGDSGSPVLSGGVLWGMHFYGTQRGTSLAIPAFILFSAGRFDGLTIRLP